MLRVVTAKAKKALAKEAKAGRRQSRPRGRRKSIPKAARPRRAAHRRRRQGRRRQGDQARNAEAEADGEPGPLSRSLRRRGKKMIKAAKKRGYVTYDQLNEVMPSEEVTSEQIEDVLAQMNEMGVNVVESEESESDEDADDDEEEGGELIEKPAAKVATTGAKEPSERTDDPVRMYLREMGTVELLSREGEIAIANASSRPRGDDRACEKAPLTFRHHRGATS